VAYEKGGTYQTAVKVVKQKIKIGRKKDRMKEKKKLIMEVKNVFY
jgi:hypothetical protein